MLLERRGAESREKRSTERVVRLCVEQPGSLCPAWRGETSGTRKVTKSQKSPFQPCPMTCVF